MNIKTIFIRYSLTREYGNARISKVLKSYNEEVQLKEKYTIASADMEETTAAYDKIKEEYETLEEDTKIIVSTSKEEVKEEDEEELLGSSKDVTEPFTVLLLGVDSKAEGIANAKSFNGDAMILVTFNPDTLTATMLSIPRDTYVPIACFSGKVENKITLNKLFILNHLFVFLFCFVYVGTIYHIFIFCTILGKASSFYVYVFYP